MQNQEWKGHLEDSVSLGKHWQNLNLTFLIKKSEKKAADMLKIFDDKIQLNTQTNQTLEAIAQAIFKSWFVDFDPVRAKAAALSEGKKANTKPILRQCR